MSTLLKTTPFKPFQGTAHYAQAVRGKLTMGILNPAGEELCAPMHCKDFIQDAFLTERTGKAAGIYGFRWEPGRIDPLAPTQRLSLHYLDKGLLEKAMSRLEPFLQRWEEKLGFDPPSKVEQAQGSPDTLVLTYPKGWTLQPIRFGALTLLIRVATGWEPEKLSPVRFMEKLAVGGIDPSLLAFTTDPGYVKKALDRFQKIWLDGPLGWETQTWEQYNGKVGDLHHSSGMVSYLRERTP